jgi:DNA-directed RNA polymerase subunit omega
VARPIREEEVILKVGGRFRLAALVQKRLRELVAGAQKLVTTNASDPLQIVYQEILEDKIGLGEAEQEPEEAGVRAALHGGPRV